MGVKPSWERGALEGLVNGINSAPERFLPGEGTWLLALASELGKLWDGALETTGGRVRNAKRKAEDVPPETSKHKACRTEPAAQPLVDALKHLNTCKKNQWLIKGLQKCTTFRQMATYVKGLKD